MRTAVLMTCHNRAKLTLRSLSLFEKAAHSLDCDIYLVDDGSTDNTAGIVKDKFPKVQIIAADGSLYWAKGMRLAWENAIRRFDYDFYLWLNDDLILKHDAVAGMFADYDAVHGVIVGACSNDEREVSCSYGVSDHCDKKIIPNGFPQRATGWLNGNLVLIPREVYKHIGMISAEYSHARADYDYAERLKRAVVPFYCSSKYVGVCINDFAEKVRKLSVIQRLRLLYQPGYWNIHDLWLFKSKYFSRCRAMISCLHLVCCVMKGL